MKDTTKVKLISVAVVGVGLTANYFWHYHIHPILIRRQMKKEWKKDKLHIGERQES